MTNPQHNHRLVYIILIYVFRNRSLLRTRWSPRGKEIYPNDLTATVDLVRPVVVSVRTYRGRKIFHEVADLVGLSEETNEEQWD